MLAKRASTAFACDRHRSIMISRYHAFFRCCSPTGTTCREVYAQESALTVFPLRFGRSRRTPRPPVYRLASSSLMSEPHIIKSCGSP